MRKILILILMMLMLIGCGQSQEAEAPNPVNSITKQTQSEISIRNPVLIPIEDDEENGIIDVLPTEATQNVSLPENPALEKEHTHTDVPTEPQQLKPTQPKKGPTAPEETKPKTEPTVTVPTQPETKSEDPEPIQPVSKPIEPEPKPPIPETTPTEPTSCSHDWKATHHEEKGHWRAGIVCDCGWTVYGTAGELVAKWNAHSASYPAEEALFNHGGYGSADKWIVDEPAYDEWVCRHCGESKS